MTILIIGGTGVLSGAIARLCLENGYSVSILTDGKGFLPPPSGLVEHLIADRNDPRQLSDAISHAKQAYWDVVFDVICYSRDQAASLHECIKHRTAQVVVVSTYLVYACSEAGALKEGAPIGPVQNATPYVRGKIAMEEYYLGPVQQSGIPVVLVRPCQILGWGSELGLVPLHNRDPYLVGRILRGEPVVLAKSPGGGRQFAYAEDISRAMLLAAQSPRSHGRVYNVASRDIFADRVHFEVIAEILQKKLQVKEIDSTLVRRSSWGWLDTMDERLLDCSAAYSDLGFVHETGQAAAVRRCMQYLQEHLDPLPLAGDVHSDIISSLTQGADIIVSALNRAAGLRAASPVDLRMNRSA